MLRNVVCMQHSQQRGSKACYACRQSRAVAQAAAAAGGTEKLNLSHVHAMIYEEEDGQGRERP